MGIGVLRCAGFQLPILISADLRLQRTGWSKALVYGKRRWEVSGAANACGFLPRAQDCGEKDVNEGQGLIMCRVEERMEDQVPSIDTRSTR
jgi:hypothetical protein